MSFQQCLSQFLFLSRNLEILRDWIQVGGGGGGGVVPGGRKAEPNPVTGGVVVVCIRQVCLRSPLPVPCGKGAQWGMVQCVGVR